MKLLTLFLLIWLGVLFPKGWIVFPILSVLLLGWSIYRFRNKKFFFLCLSSLAIGVCVSNIHLDFKRDTYSGFVVSAKENYALVYSLGEKFYVYEKNNDYEIGDYVKIIGFKADLNFSTIESAFDFEEYLNNKGVKYQIKYTKIERKFKIPIRLKKYKSAFLSKLSNDAKSVVGSILFNVSEDSETSILLKNLHLTKLISSSGLFAYAFLKILDFLLGFTKIKPKWSKIIGTSALCLYGALTFFKFSIIKICFLSIFSWINEYFLKKKFDYLDRIGIIGILFLIMDFHLAYQDGFILGFIMPIFGVVSSTIYENKKKIPKRLFQILLTYLFFLPFEIKFFNSISPLSCLFEIILTPFFVFLVLLSVIFIFIPIGTPLLNYAVFPLKYIVMPFKYLNISVYMPEMPTITIFIYYALYLALIYYLSIKYKPIYKTILVIYTTFLILYSAPISNLLSESVTFINVGQGDCCLIRKGMSTVMIDTGGSVYRDIANDCLIPYLKKNKIYKIDVLITTHNDEDHSGGVESLENYFNVKRYFDALNYFPFTFKGITFSNYNTYVNEYSDNNYKSLVIGFNVHNTNYLVMGDAPIEIEKRIMKDYKSIPCDVLKIGHHGSNTSSYSKFISWLKPKEAIISVGKNNSYGHPHDSVIKTLKSNGVIVKRTDELGTITYFNYIFM